MRDSLEIFQKIFEDYTSNKYVQNHLLELVECLYTDLERERSSTTNLQQQMMELTKEQDFGITSKFTTLKAEYVELKQKLEALRTDNDDLNIQLIAKDEEIKKRLSENEEALKSYYQTQMKEKDVIMRQKEKEIEDSKAAFKETERKLYNDIQSAEAASALEIDKAETQFRQQLAEANKRIKENVDTCNVLRIELMAVKEQFVEHKRRSTQKIAELQRRLKLSQGFEAASSSKVTQDRSWCGSGSVNISVNIDEKTSKYQPLDVSSKRFEILEDTPINLKKGPVGRNTGQSVSDSGRAIRNVLPPLANLSDKPANKRRKLFNPDDLSYLNVDLSDVD